MTLRVQSPRSQVQGRNGDFGRWTLDLGLSFPQPARGRGPHVPFRWRPFRALASVLRNTLKQSSHVAAASSRRKREQGAPATCRLLRGAPSACQDEKSSRRCPRFVPIARVIAKIASCRAPQSARALWPLWPDFRAMTPVLNAPARRSYGRQVPHNWTVTLPRRAPASYLPRRRHLASERRKNVRNGLCGSCRY